MSQQKLHFASSASIGETQTYGMRPQENSAQVFPKAHDSGLQAKERQ